LDAAKIRYRKMDAFTITLEGHTND